MKRRDQIACFFGLDLKFKNISAHFNFCLQNSDTSLVGLLILVICITNILDIDSKMPNADAGDYKWPVPC